MGEKIFEHLRVYFIALYSIFFLKNVLAKQQKKKIRVTGTLVENVYL